MNLDRFGNENQTLEGHKIVLSHPISLTSYAATGFLHPVNVMTRDEAATCRRRLEDAERTCREKRLTFPRDKPYMTLGLANELVRRPSMLDAVEAIIGPNILVWDAAFIVKEPRHEGRFTWHQDLTYWGLSPKEGVVSTWLALSPSTLESGCMKVIPGSHSNGILPHKDTFADDNMLTRGQALAVDIDESEAVNVELEPGDMSLHDTHLFHRSAPNRSSDRRIGFNVQYIAPHVQQVVGPVDSAMLVRGEDTEGNFEIEQPACGEIDLEGFERRTQLEKRRRTYLFDGIDDPSVDGRRETGARQSGG